MKALVKFAKGREGMAVQEMPLPVPKTGEVRIAVKGAGICGSDIHSMLDERETIMPVILGHEFVGVVDQVCGDVGDLKVGDWVTGLPACYGCGECDWCKSGQVTLCSERKSIGTHVDGAMAEYLVMPAKFCFKIAPDAKDKIAYAAAEPLACAVRGVYEKLNVKKGDVCVVSGPGTIGLFAAKALKSRGAYVIMSGLPVDHERLATALSVGIDAVAESYEELEEKVLAKNPNGADVAVEAAGVAPSLHTCYNIVKMQGTILQLGVYRPEITCKPNQIVLKELTVVGSNSSSVNAWKITLELLNSGEIDLTPVLSLRFALDEWEKGFQATMDKSAFKILLTP